MKHFSKMNVSNIGTRGVNCWIFNLHILIDQFGFKKEINETDCCGRKELVWTI